MRFQRHALALGFLTALLCLDLAQAAQASLETYGRLPSVEGVDISPNGQRIVMTVTDGEKRSVVITDAATHDLLDEFDAGPLKIRRLQWADNDNIIITSSRKTGIRNVETTSKENEYFQAQLLNIPKRATTPLLDMVTNNVPILLREPVVRQIDGRAQIFVESVSFDENGEGVVTLYRLDVERGRTKLVLAGTEQTNAIWVNADGEPVMQLLNVEGKGPGLRLRQPGKGWRTVMAPAGVDDLAVLGISADGASAMLQYVVDDEEIAAEVNLQTLAWASRPQPVAHGVFFDPLTDRYRGRVDLVGDVESYIFIDPADQAMWQAVQKTFPGERASLVGWSSDRKKLIVHVDSPTEGPAYALVDMSARTSAFIALAYETLRPEAISPVTSISYKAADGMTITGYLTTPRGREAKNLPLIVLPHGGPAARDEPGFDWWSQALAARGYAVLRPNFRGSSGFGSAFLRAGHGEFGRKMQTDLSDGVRYLASENIIDPARVCIAGASYGGYAALAGATIDLGVYRCAVSIAGPSDLKRMLIVDRRTKGESALRYWSRFMGVDGARDPDLSLISPASLADRVEIPVLLIHGKDDVVVPFEQSTLMVDAMKKAGKPVELVTLDGEDHWLSRSETRLKMLESTVQFLEKHNPASLVAATNQ